MVSIHDSAALSSLRRQCRIEPYHLRRLRHAFYRKQMPAAEALDAIPPTQRTHLAAEIAFHCLELVARHDSGLDGASKLIFRTPGGRLIEAVILRISSGRTSLCVSSQAGCAVRCSFCATGQMDTVHNLSRDEILDQVIQANALLRHEGRRVRNVVFMGMGEPLHNESAVHEAVAALVAPECFGLAPGHVLVSTVGIPAALVRCAERFPLLGLAVSLHSARQETRQRLIPLARHHPLDCLREAMARVTYLQRRPLMIEYLLLDGVNDTDEELHALIAYLGKLPVHVNLIPYNPISAAPGLLGSPPPMRGAWAAALKAAGFTVTIRYSLGADIAAACGQLATASA